MRKIIILIVAILLILVFFLELKAASIQKSIIPADAKWVVHIDMKKLTSTKLYELFMNDESTVKIRKGTDKLFKKLKFDPLKDIMGITAYGAEKDEEKTVVCFSGNIDKAYILGLLKEEADHQEISYGKYIIYSWGHDDFGVFVSDSLGLFSENEEAIKTALDVIDGKKKNISSSPMMKYVKEIPSDAFLMAVVDDISSLAGKHDKAVMLKKAGMASFAIMEKKGDVALDLKFTTGSPEDAKNVEQMIKGLVAFGNLQLKEEKDVLELLERLRISIDGNKVQMGLTYPIDKLFNIISGRTKIRPSFLLGLGEL
jgi:hypothetical protein